MLADTIKEKLSQNDIKGGLKEIEAFLGTLKDSPGKSQAQETLLPLMREERSLQDQITQGTLVGDDYEAKMSLMVRRILHFLPTITALEKKIVGRLASIQTDPVFYNRAHFTDHTAFARRYERIYQGFKLGARRNESTNLIHLIEDKILANQEKNLGYWVDEGKTDVFSLLHTNTSVLYFLLQLGYPLSSPICESVLTYFEQIQEVHIQHRAKFYFDIQMGRITTYDFKRFLELLISFQHKKGTRNYGAFRTFKHGNADVKIDNRAAGIHYGGHTLHCCLITDVLLHASSNDQIVNHKIEEILSGTRNFLMEMYKENEGWLINRDEEHSRQYTSWFCHLAPQLGIALDNSWKERLRKTLVRTNDPLFMKALFVMNLCLLVQQYQQELDEELNREIFTFCENYYMEVRTSIQQKNEPRTAKDLSLIGRSLLYINQAFS